MKRKPGRPPSQVANVPRFMANRSRVTLSVVMPAPTAALLKEYVRWGAKSQQITEEEAQAYTMEQALGDLIRSDRMFADAQREAVNKEVDGSRKGADSQEQPPATADADADAAEESDDVDLPDLSSEVLRSRAQNGSGGLGRGSSGLP
jgi:hypothetical protein